MTKAWRVTWLVALGAAGCQLQAGVGAGTTPHPVTASAQAGTQATSSSAPAADDRASGAGNDPAITIPDVKGMTRDQAEAALKAAGVRATITVDGDASQGKICSSMPAAGQPSAADLPIEIAYCPAPPGPAETRPDLGGLTVEEATKRIRAAGFTGKIDVHVEPAGSGSCATGTVCAVDPERWELNLTDTMTLYVGGKLSVSAPPP